LDGDALTAWRLATESNEAAERLRELARRVLMEPQH
jgi:hypothetical protein